MNKDFERTLMVALKDLVPKIEKYRMKNVTKYNAESAGEHGGEYSVKEKYKNRVRVVDIFLPTLKIFVESYHSISSEKKDKSLE